MRVLIACEESGVVRDAFLARGHDAWSCDILPSRGKPLGHWFPDLYPRGHQLHAHQLHYQCDIMELLFGRVQHSMALEGQALQWDLLIAHPECRYLCVSGIHRNRKDAQRELCTLAAITFVERLWAADIPRIAIENPVGILRTRSVLGKATQYIQPYQFGHDASKRTGLWLRNLPPLRPTKMIEPRYVDGKPRWANQTDGGQNRLGPSPTRSADRARTYQGIADAMANQWGGI